MIIKRYIVDNMNEAMIKIRYELGNEAVIVSQRKIREKGIKGFFRHKKYEVTAAADDKPKKNNEEIIKKDELRNEMDELKSMMANLLSKQSEVVDNTKKSKGKKLTINKKLLENDIPDEIIEDIYSKVKAKGGKNLRTNSKQFEEEVNNIIKNIIKTDTGINGRVHVLIGPTGVGKTTTIAKLAGLYSLYKNKKVGLITIDTYRIGAVEQLKIYANILSAPFGVILTVKDIPEVMKTMEDCDLIFIDTTGRNSKNAMQVSEIRQYIDALKPDGIHLVLSMTTKCKDIKRIANDYKIIKYTSLILTKIDETDTCGSILASLYYANVPVSFLTTGQNVPDDIQEAKTEKLFNLIMGAEQ
ncbi:MAG TPA: flagellar biosynthesis protein FlhF [Clostridiaceae bacterium]|jgi:flagellar biosynthesis protein FlhF|nr:flagellar biosynthesis protein FlhF [Clostridiaceae bacterium]HBN27654.1 flagellar biosynthesis protein FlhF [Clostridiaceae bacterium]